MTATVRIIDLISDGNDKKYETAGRMAAAIVELVQTNGECMPQDLNEKGFTPAEVADNWHMARSLAAVELKLMGGARTKCVSLFGRV